MRFKQYLIEDRKVDQARRKLAKHLKVDPEYLHYIGDDEVGYYFNVTDKTHKDYESTKFVKK